VVPRRSLGCLTRLVLQLLLLGAFAVAVAAAVTWVVAPWSYYLGGRFHVMPGWQGVGTLHAAAGDYRLQVWFAPQTGRRLSRNPYLRGWGALCTPRGERFSLRLSAQMFQRPNLDTNHYRVDITMYSRPWSFSFTNDSRPRLSLRGRWENPDLVMDDGGSLSRAFLADNTVYRGPASRQPAARETVAIVLHELPWTAWFTPAPACAAK
jgi:hypothetical protein